IVTGHLEQQVRASCGTGRRFGVELRYVFNGESDRGLGTALLAVEPLARERFVFLLGDELYLETNHAALADAPAAPAVCAVLETDDPDVIRKNYGVVLDGDRIAALVEKPLEPPSRLAGLGTWIFEPRVFEHARATRVSPRTGKLELIDVLDRAVRALRPLPERQYDPRPEPRELPLPVAPLRAPPEERRDPGVQRGRVDRPRRARLPAARRRGRRDGQLLARRHGGDRAVARRRRALAASPRLRRRAEAGHRGGLGRHPRSRRGRCDVPGA